MHLEDIKARAHHDDLDAMRLQQDPRAKDGQVAVQGAHNCRHRGAALVEADRVCHIRAFPPPDIFKALLMTEIKQDNTAMICSYRELEFQLHAAQKDTHPES